MLARLFAAGRRHRAARSRPRADGGRRRVRRRPRLPARRPRAGLRDPGRVRRRDGVSLAGAHRARDRRVRAAARTCGSGWRCCRSPTSRSAGHRAAQARDHAGRGASRRSTTPRGAESTSLWPEAHYLGPLHPASTGRPTGRCERWAATRSSPSRGEVDEAVRAAARHADQRARPGRRRRRTSSSQLPRPGRPRRSPLPQPVATLREALDVMRLRPGATNTGAPDGRRRPRRVRRTRRSSAARTVLDGAFEAAAAERRRTGSSAGQERVDAWEHDADELVQRARDHDRGACRVEEERDLVAHDAARPAHGPPAAARRARPRHDRRGVLMCQRRDRRRRGLDQRALLHHRRHQGVLPGPGARAPQGGWDASKEARHPAHPVHRGPRQPARPVRHPRRRRPTTDAADVRALNADVRAILGLRRRRADAHGRRVRSPSCTPPGSPSTAPLAIVDAAPGRRPSRTCSPRTPTTSLEPFVARRRRPSVTSVARLLSRRSSSRDDAPAFALVLAGRWALVAERERWAEGRYLAVDLQLVCERNDDQARRRDRPRADLPVAPSRSRPTPRATSGGTAILEESVKHTVGVSQGPARGRPALHRDHRQRGGAPAARRRASTRCRPRRRSRWPSSRCGSSTGSCSCSTPRRRPSWACCRSARRSTRAATASTGCAS